MNATKSFAVHLQAGLRHQWTCALSTKHCTTTSTSAKAQACAYLISCAIGQGLEEVAVGHNANLATWYTLPEDLHSSSMR